MNIYIKKRGHVSFLFASWKESVYFLRSSNFYFIYFLSRGAERPLSASNIFSSFECGMSAAHQIKIKEFMKRYKISMMNDYIS